MTRGANQSLEIPGPARVLITTSRNPTQGIRTFSNDLSRAIPNTVRVNRGKSSLITLAEKALEYRAEEVLIVDRWRGGVGRLQLFEVSESGLTPRYPVIYVKSTKLRRDFPHTHRRTAATLTLQTALNIPSQAKKLAEALSRFLGIQTPSSENPLPESARTLRISLTDAHRIQITFLQPPDAEIGPRITISHLVWTHRE